MDHLDEALKHVTDFSVAVDGGAHVGSWSKALSERFGRVISYELAPDTFYCLKKNMESVPNVRPVHAALGHEPGRVGVAGAQHTLGRCVGEGDTIPRVTLDDENLPSLGFLKLDLEGYEYFGLKGAEKTIRKFLPVILVEEKGHDSRFGIEPRAATAFLKSIGYRHIFHKKPDSLFVPPKRGFARLFERAKLAVFPDPDPIKKKKKKKPASV
jgi:FkbM family methyltransferase